LSPLPETAPGLRLRPVQGLTLHPGAGTGVFSHCGGAVLEPMASQRQPDWVNTPVLLEAIERYEQGRLARPLRLWLQGLLEIDPLEPPSQLKPPC